MTKEKLEAEVINLIKKLGTPYQVKELLPMININYQHYSGLTPKSISRGFYIFIGEPFKRKGYNYYTIDICWLTLKPSDKYECNLSACAQSVNIEELFTEEYIKKSGIIRQARLNTLLS
jgi:hypothetical protein